MVPTGDNALLPETPQVEYMHTISDFEGAPTYEPEVAQVTSQVTSNKNQHHQALPPTPQDLFRTMRASMRLPRHTDHPVVQQELKWLKRHPTYLQRLQPRLQRYLPYIHQKVMERNMPVELALLPIVESALDIYAFSHGGAAGPWQFLRGTAKQYGVSINDWYDGRRDIVASTDAALDFLTDLYERFDDWNLALAGYNAGQGNVNRALRKKPNADYWDLDLPRETKRYVPRLLAIAEVVANPSKYGVVLPPIQPQAQFHIVETHSQFQLNKLADAAGLSLEALYRFNPAFNQWATAPNGPHRLIIPVELDPILTQEKIDTIPVQHRIDWLQVKVREGDTLSHIAKRHGVDVGSLKAANQLSHNRIRAGAKLLIPKNSNASSKNPHRYVNANNPQYVVRRGDSMWSIAKQHGVNLTRLMKANHIGPRDTLRVGSTLSIPVVASSRASATGAREAVTRKVRYKVRRGDSLARIASKFDVTIRQLAAWNDLDVKRYLQPGQGLLVYVSVTGGP